MMARATAETGAYTCTRNSGSTGMVMRDESAVAKERRAVTMMKTETGPMAVSSSKG